MFIFYVSIDGKMFTNNFVLLGRVERSFSIFDIYQSTETFSYYLYTNCICL